VAAINGFVPEQSGINEIVTTVDEVQVEWRPFEATDDEQWSSFIATAYTADCHGCIGITKTGVDVQNTTLYEGKTVVAVDPDVIPLGSTVEVRLADGTIIEGTAQDTGGKIRGNRIDVLHESYDEAIEFGRQDVSVRVVNE